MSLPARSTFLRRVSERRGVRQFVKFGIVGASGFAVNFILFTALQQVVPNRTGTVQFYTIYSIAFLAGGVSNYFLNRRWTFRSSGPAGREGAQFLSVSVLALIVGLIASAIVSPYLGHGHKTWFIGTCAGIVVNFFVNKYWTFRSVA
jgi:putative flippase GtrA